MLESASTKLAANSPSSSQPSPPNLIFYPPSTHRAHPLDNRWPKVLASLLPHLHVPQGFEAAHPAIGTPNTAPSNFAEAFPLYHYLNHPLPYIEICGIAVGLEYKDYIRGWILDVDDGSGEVVQALCLKARPVKEAQGPVFGRRNGGVVQVTGKGGAIRERVAGPGELISPPVPEWKAVGWIDAQEIDTRNAEVGSTLKVKGRYSRWKTIGQVLVEKLEVIRDTAAEVNCWKQTTDTWNSVLCKPWTLSEEDLQRIREEDEERTKAKEAARERKYRRKGEKQRRREEKELRRAEKSRRKAEALRGDDPVGRSRADGGNDELNESAPEVKGRAVILSQTENEGAVTSFQKPTSETPKKTPSREEQQDTNGIPNRTNTTKEPLVQGKPQTHVISTYTLDWNSLDLSNALDTQPKSSSRGPPREPASSLDLPSQRSTVPLSEGPNISPILDTSKTPSVPEKRPKIINKGASHTWSSLDVEAEMARDWFSKQAYGEEWIKNRDELGVDDEISKGPIRENSKDEARETKKQPKIVNKGAPHAWSSPDMEAEMAKDRFSKQAHGEEWIKIQDELRADEEASEALMGEILGDDEQATKKTKRSQRRSWEEEWERVNL